MRIAFAVISLFAAACIFLTGCRTTVSAPPGFIAAGSAAGGRIEFPAEVTPEAQYAMLCWYIDVEGEAAGDHAAAGLAVALNARMDLRNRFLAAAAAPLISEFPQYMRLDNSGRLEVDAVALAENLECGRAIEILEVVRKLLHSTGRITVPVDECKEFLRAGKGPVAESSFLTWATENPVLDLPPGTAAGLEVKIDDTEKALRLKKNIFDVEAEARRLVAEGRFYEVLEKIDGFAASLSPDVSLKVIGDDVTLKSFYAFRRDIAGFAIEGTLQALFDELPVSAAEEGAGERVSAIEERLSSARTIWNTNSRYLEQLDKATLERCRELTGKMAQLRSAIWQAEVEKLRNAGRYWEMACKVAELRRELSSTTNMQFRCYHHPFSDAAARIDEALHEIQRQAVSGGMAKYLAAGQSAMDIGNHFGTVVVTDYMIRTLAEMTLKNDEEMPQDWRSIIERSAEMRGRAEKKMSENRSGIGIWDFASVAPGLGETLADDLAFEIGDLLKRLGITAFSDVRRLEAGAAAGAELLLQLDDGRVAEYTVSSDKVTESTRLENAYSSVRMAETDNSAAVQDLEERTIRISSRTRQAHIRFFFTFKTASLQRRIECNEFYSRLFVNESFDPEKDIRILKQVAADDSHKPAASMPVLKTQRIWSDGEMLDFARRDALRLAALQLVDAFLESQLANRRMAAEMAADGKYAEAVDMLGRAYFMLQTLGLAEDGGRKIDFGVPLAAAAYPELAASIRRRMREIVQVSEELLAQAAGFIEM